MLPNDPTEMKRTLALVSTRPRRCLPPALAVVTLALVALAPAFPQEGPAEIDFGSIEGSTYTNVYFGLRLELPADWSALDQAAMLRLAEAGADMIAGDDENLQAIVRASELQTVNMLGVFRHPLGAPVPYNPSFVGVAERLDNAPGIRKGADYLFHARRMLEAGQLVVSFPGEVSAVRIGGQEFDVMPVELEVLDIVVQQRYYATVMKGYALVFISSFTTPEERAALDGVVESISFE